MLYMELPNEIESKIFLFLSHPCADLIKELSHEILTNSYIETYMEVFIRKTEEHFSEDDSFVENWQEWINNDQGDIYEHRCIMPKLDLSDDSDDD